MRRVFYLIFLICISAISNAQTVLDYDLIKLDKVEDFRAADPFAFQASSYLLSNPIDANKTDRNKTGQFLLKWINGTPDYGFTFGGSAKILNNSADLMTLYLASMVKFCFENKAESKDQDKIRIGSWEILLNYCADPKNNVRLTRKLKKLIDANAKGELEKELSS